MKTFLFLLCLWMASQGSSALNWNQSVKKSGSTLYACSKDTVIFPFLFNLSESESIISMTWTYHGNDVTKSIGTLFLKDFMTTRNYFDKVILNKNGNFTMQNVGFQDTGNYVLTIQTKDKDQNEKTYTKEISLVVAKNMMYKGNNLVAKLSGKADWNSDTESFSLSLTCGDFIFKNNDNALIDVEWITPGGSVKNSTKYRDGKFYLQLDNPVKGGQYVCKIPEKYITTVCASSNDNTQVTVNINEDKARIILVENENEKLKDQVKKLKNQDKKLNNQDKNLQKRIETLEKQILNLTPLGCEDLQLLKSGKSTIYTAQFQPVTIYCDQDTDGGRWNVFQKREDGTVDFRRGWSDYRNGFGDLHGEFWLGLETVHQMTSDGRKYELRFDLQKHDGSKYYAVYDDFSIGSESEGYVIHHTGYRGNAGDSFGDHSNLKFSTKDRDNDEIYDDSCAAAYLSGWWFSACGYSNLNGIYGRKGAYGLYWRVLSGNRETLKKTEMKFRAKQ